MLAFAAVASLSLGAWSYLRFLGRRGPSGAPIALDLPAHLDAKQTAQWLARHGVTDRPFWMRMHLALTKTSGCQVPGAHVFPPATPREIVAMLCRSNARPSFKVTFPEGATRFAMADRLAASGIVGRAAFLRASGSRDLLASLGIDPPSLAEESLRAAVDSAEGFLFPATYSLRVDSDATDVVRALVREGDRRWRQVAEAHAKGLAALEALGMNRRAILTLASMIEKETGVASERPTIASVFLNRLGDPAFRRLQSDPTAMYGCLAIPERVPACANFNGRASPEVNRDPANVYSTYVIDGLPPGPIANPGDAAIAAVLAPETTKYRYFVARGGGRHAFSETYEQHLDAVRQWRDRHD